MKPGVGLGVNPFQLGIFCDSMKIQPGEQGVYTKYMEWLDSNITDN